MAEERLQIARELHDMLILAEVITLGALARNETRGAHYKPEFPERDDAWADRIAAQANFPVYFIDDETAIRVNGDQTDILSEGRWRFHP